MEGIAPNSCTKPVSEKKARPQEQLNCPRCNSTNTKFCYYNNYSLTQPRYFCKTCRRYWTEGGSLRNVPVGGGSRKNKKIPSSSSSSAAAAAATASSSKVPDLNPPTQNPKMHGGQDLNLGFPDMDQKYHHGITSYVDSSNSSSAAPTATISALELLRTGMASRGLNYPYNNVHHPLLMPNSNGTLYPSGFPMQEVKPSLGFSLDHDGLGDHSGRLLFPFGDNQIKQFSGSEAEQNKEQGNSTGYWPGMIGEGSW